MRLFLPAMAWGLAALLGAVVFWEYEDQHTAEAALTFPSPRQVPPARDSVAAPSAASGPLWGATLLARPLFSPSRRPLAVAGPLAAAAAPLPRLTGVLVSKAARGAIFAAQADGKTIMVTEGSWIGAYRVRSITPGLVILFGPEGEIALRPAFAPAAVPSSTGAPPAAAPAGAAAAAPMSTLLAPPTDTAKPSVLDQLRQAASPLSGIPGLATPAPPAVEAGSPARSPAPEAVR